MKRTRLFVIVAVICCQMNADSQQNIGIGTSTPNGSSLLDINSINKGLLIPRINLVSETDLTTIVNPLISLLIYNTNSALPDGDGFYFWNGNKWSKFATRTNLAKLAWNIGGNSGINPISDFIGTTDSKPLVFKTNNILSGKIDPAGNNIFLGQFAGESVTTGHSNSFLGHQAGAATTTGYENVANGYQALYTNSIGRGNTALGYKALFTTTTGGLNTSCGFSSLSNNTTGSDNTAVGIQALLSNTGGNDNTGIGYLANVSTGNLSNATVIGNHALVSTSNTMSFGNDEITRWAFGISTTNGTHALEVGLNSTNGNGAYLTAGGTWTNTSDIDKKEDFANVNPGDLLQKIAQLSIQRWKYKGTKEYHIGPTAQEFYKLFNVGTDDKGISTVDPAGIALAAIQEQQKIIQQLLKRIEVLEKK